MKLLHEERKNYYLIIEEINSIQDLGLNSEAIDTMADEQNEVGGLLVKFYIDKESKYIVKQSIDLSDMMQIGLQEAFVSQGSSSIVNSVDCKMDIAYQDILENQPERALCKFVMKELIQKKITDEEFRQKAAISIKNALEKYLLNSIYINVLQ